MKRRRRLLQKKRKPQIRGNRRKLESWFTEIRTPITAGVAYRMFNSGSREKGKSAYRVTGKTMLHATARHANFSHKCGRCRTLVEILYTVEAIGVKLCRACCLKGFEAGDVRIKPLNEIQRAKAESRKRAKAVINA